MEDIMILDTLVMLLVLTAVIGSIAIWASWNERNANEWIANNVDGCPFKYKWQMADDLSTPRLSGGSKMDVKFSYLMVMPKDEVKKLWLLNKEGG